MIAEKKVPQEHLRCCDGELQQLGQSLIGAQSQSTGREAERNCSLYAFPKACWPVCEQIMLHVAY